MYYYAMSVECWRAIPLPQFREYIYESNQLVNFTRNIPALLQSNKTKYHNIVYLPYYERDKLHPRRDSLM